MEVEHFKVIALAGLCTRFAMKHAVSDCMQSLSGRARAWWSEPGGKVSGSFKSAKNWRLEMGSAVRFVQVKSVSNSGQWIRNEERFGCCFPGKVRLGPVWVIVRRHSHRIFVFSAFGSRQQIIPPLSLLTFRAMALETTRHFCGTRFARIR
jgi:hypothetical protein